MTARPAASQHPAADRATVTTAGVDVDAVASAVTACPYVAGLSGGPHGSAASYLPGRRVVGVRVPDGALTVHVVGVYGPSAAQIAAQVRAAAAPLAGGRPVDVVLEDVQVPDRDTPTGAPTAHQPPTAPGGDR